MKEKHTLRLKSRKTVRMVMAMAIAILACTEAAAQTVAADSTAATDGTAIPDTLIAKADTLNGVVVTAKEIIRYDDHLLLYPDKDQRQHDEADAPSGEAHHPPPAQQVTDADARHQKQKYGKHKLTDFEYLTIRNNVPEVRYDAGQHAPLRPAGPEVRSRTPERHPGRARHAPRITRRTGTRRISQMKPLNQWTWTTLKERAKTHLRP